jgi:hypothetical protein
MGLVQKPGEIGARVPLEQFLESLDPETGAELRAAAGRIDELGRTADALSGVERRLLPWALGAAGLFLAGIWLVFQSGTGAALAASLCLLALPLIAAIYAWQIKPRTAADTAMQELNRSHFLPHGGLYFPPGDGAACVVRVDWTPPPEPEEDATPVHLRDPRKARNRTDPSW